jgi:hypothetical protein
MSGDFEASVNSTNYYSEFSVEQPIAIPANTVEVLARSIDAVGAASDSYEVGLAESLNSFDRSNVWLYPDDVVIDTTDDSCDITVDNSPSPAFSTYLYFKDKTAVPGEVYVTNFTGQSTVSIPASSHQLNNFSIRILCYEADGTDLIRVLPDSASIDQATGDVTVNFNETIDGRIILTSVDAGNSVTGTIASGATDTITIPSTDTSFLLADVYYFDASGDYQWALPDSIEYDDTTGEATITITNTDPVSRQFAIYYEFADIAVNTIKVTGTVTSTGIDTEPHITVWGIPHGDLYPETASAGGHVTHIDSYKSAGESRLLCGLGGNLFRALTAAEIGTTATPTRYVDLRRRVNSNTVLNMPFHATGTTAGASETVRTRGVIEADGISNGEVTVSSATYNSLTGYLDYTLTLTNKAILDSAGAPTTLSAVLSTTTGLEDYVTISNMNHSKLNGMFKIKALTDGVDEITISVENSSIISSDFDESNAGGTAVIATDQLLLNSASVFEAEDSLSSDITNSLVVRSSSGSTIVVKNVESRIELPTGLRLFGTRTSDTFSIRDSSGNADVTYLVKGDMLDITGFDRKIRITSVDPTASTITLDEAITLTDSSLNQVTLTPVGRWYTVEIPDSDGDIAPATRTVTLDTNDYQSQPIVRSTIINDNMYFTNDSDEVMKFDGTSVYRAGLPNWKPELFVNLVTTGDVTFVPSTAECDNTTAGNIFQLTTSGANNIGLFSVGDLVYEPTNKEIYEIVEIDDTNDQIKVSESINVAGIPATFDLVRIKDYRYYFRFNMVDANNNIIASASTGTEDFRVYVTEDSQIQLKLVGLPDIDIYDYDRIEVQIYRTFDLQNVPNSPFMLIETIPVDFDNHDGYIVTVDGIEDDALNASFDADLVAGPLLGNELPINWSEPLRASYITSAANRLIFGNVKDYPKYDISLTKLRNDGTLDVADLTSTNEVRWLFRKDNADSGTDTNMVDRVAYEFVDIASPTSTITPNTDIATTATNFTITDATHTLSEGDWVYLYHTSADTDNDLTFAGWYQVASVVASTSFTINMSNHDRAATGGTVYDVNAYITASDTADIPVPLGEDGNYNQREGNLASGRSYGTVATIRLANAINVSMRILDRSLSSNSSFVPWLNAKSGSEYGEGRLIVEQQRVFEKDVELVLDSAHGTSYNVFVNNVQRTAGASIGADTRLFPSRIIISYTNYPEMFDGPANSGTSVVDVNPADGQEITGVVPFFAEAAFGAAQKEGIIIVFKTNSIYVVDVNQLSTAGATTQRLDTQGLGCTFPYSIAPTKNGIMFANRSGIYKLSYDLTISYIGKMIERVWQQDVNRDATLAVTGHHYAVERRYQLSVPVASNSSNSDVLVYDHDREAQGGVGAWTRYDNFNSTGWANLDNDAFFGTTNGQVMSIRRLGNSTDYRDDASAVAMEIVTKPYSFGTPSIRHKVRAIMTNFEISGDMTGTALDVAADLSDNFTTSSRFQITDDTAATGAYRSRQVVTLRSSIRTQKVIYLQLKYTNSVVDEDVVIAGIGFTAAPLTQRGIQQPGSSGEISS